MRGGQQEKESLEVEVLINSEFSQISNMHIEVLFLLFVNQFNLDEIGLY